ncbi:hypothetical protein [Homoserinibacter sp. GY 40078]|uniref:hypothetical protein n=1 Tax=Homoserinibacter sp. GY 40078 TaxID=2603275 RepID=UPI0011C96201|nr:hypothetical protein [Homoserinibacter sp. GY 40078]TXK19342.1 hypothetical protein FVQ89_05365 [Homoserinibacter sp. GY 40078]
MRARFVAAIALSGALALGLSGCNFITYAATTKEYDPSDGVNFTVGDLELRSMLVITDDGETGSLVGVAVNDTGSAIPFTLEWETASGWTGVDLSAAADGSTSFGFGDGQRVNLDDIGTEPGELLEVVVHIDGDQKGAKLPVLDTTFSEYEDSLPTPTPTPVITPNPTETPAS